MKFLYIKAFTFLSTFYSYEIKFCLWIQKRKRKNLQKMKKLLKKNIFCNALDIECKSKRSLLFIIYLKEKNEAIPRVIIIRRGFIKNLTFFNRAILTYLKYSIHIFLVTSIIYSFLETFTWQHSKRDGWVSRLVHTTVCLQAFFTCVFYKSTLFLEESNASHTQVISWMMNNAEARQTCEDMIDVLKNGV